ncbi:MAG TPA: cytochrome o ubiquinol oxidase subunit IV [Nevskiaceae bacterium]|nr:cytochrome o ubiquinol oxidase subunit IV [Nevskiaceae bacterium]
MKDTQTEAGHGSLLSYTAGFGLSIILTLEAYFAVINEVFRGNGLVTLIATLAIVQLVVQLVFFLHLGRESKPRWNLTVFAFMLLVIGIVVIGSLWIMHNLNYHMSSHDMGNYLLHDEGIQP